MNRRTAVLLFLSFLLTVNIFAQTDRSYTSSEILLQLKKLNTVGAVLYIAAHPDDENTRLIAYLANEKCLRTGYLSLTRGDGGQNLIGPEQGIELGVIRTQELLAARRIDGGEQFFTRAYDFGFSKSPEETLQKWNKDSVLSDMVWVIRNFRPDIIITRFATDGSGGHGHHTASAILAEEAFDAAGDPARFPEQLQYVEVWKPHRLFWNVSSRFQNPNANMSPYIKLDVGGYNPLLGKSYGEIAAESRSMHKSQGFGSAKQRGEYFEYFKPIKGDTANLKDIFDDIDFTWKRMKGGKIISSLINDCISGFSFQSTNLIAKDLYQVMGAIMKNPNYNNLFHWYETAEKTLLACEGVFVENTSSKYNFSIGENVLIEKTSIRRANKLSGVFLKDSFSYKPNSISELYWLKIPIEKNLFNVERKQDLMKNNIPPYSILHPTKISFNQMNFSIWCSQSYKWVDPEKGELYRPVVITPPLMINVIEDVAVFSDNKSKKVKVILKAGKDSVSGYIKVSSETKSWGIVKGSNNSNSIFKEDSVFFNLTKKIDERTFEFEIEPFTYSKNEKLKIEAFVNGQTYTKGIKEIKYDHIPVQTLFPEAEVKLVKLDLVKKSKRIGYIPGAGDEVQGCLNQLGYEVVTLTDDQLATENLINYDAIITGVRAYNTNERLTSFKQKLMDYVAAGGNLIVQYNTNSWAGPLSSDIGPYKFKITRNRITDEVAKVNFLLPNHQIFNSPNKITEKDFEDWIQERSIYHAGEWDSNFVAPISMTDPYEMTIGGVSPKGKPDNGALIIVKHGKGNFVYTGLVFFRQLPAGIPGAYRFMVNLIELGK